MNTLKFFYIRYERQLRVKSKPSALRWRTLVYAIVLMTQPFVNANGPYKPVIEIAKPGVLILRVIMPNALVSDLLRMDTNENVGEVRAVSDGDFEIEFGNNTDQSIYVLSGTQKKRAKPVLIVHPGEVNTLDAYEEGGKVLSICRRKMKKSKQDSDSEDDDEFNEGDSINLALYLGVSASNEYYDRKVSDFSWRKNSKAKSERSVRGAEGGSTWRSVTPGGGGDDISPSLTDDSDEECPTSILQNLAVTPELATAKVKESERDSDIKYTSVTCEDMMMKNPKFAHAVLSDGGLACYGFEWRVSSAEFSSNTLVKHEIPKVYTQAVNTHVANLYDAVKAIKKKGYVLHVEESK